MLKQILILDYLWSKSSIEVREIISNHYEMDLTDEQLSDNYPPVKLTKLFNEDPISDICKHCNAINTISLNASNEYYMCHNCGYDFGYWYYDIYGRTING